MRDRRRITRLLGRSLLYAVLLFFAGLTAVPFIWMVTSAFKAKEDFFSSLFLPGGQGFLGVAWDRLTLGNFRRLFHVLPMARSLLNSIFLASTCSLFATLCGAMGGYGLSKFHFRGRGWLTTLVLGTAILPMPLLLAPRFELIYHLHLLDTYAGYLLPQLAPAFGVFLFRQAMLNHVPAEIIESARLDGCGEIRIFFTLVLPLVRPMIGAFIIITFLGVWNDFIGPQIIIQTTERLPLAVTLASMQNNYGTDYGLLMAGTLVSVAPIICLFLLLQKEFISGLTSGTVKG
jgi:ABC-type glycerol-3-phosphate transport system permease component